MDPVDGPWRLLFYIQMSGSFLHPDPYLLVLTLRIHFFPLKKGKNPAKSRFFHPSNEKNPTGGFLGGGNKTLTSLLVGWFFTNPSEKYYIVKIRQNFPKFRDENFEKYLSCHEVACFSGRLGFKKKHLPPCRPNGAPPAVALYLHWHYVTWTLGGAKLVTSPL